MQSDRQRIRSLAESPENNGVTATNSSNFLQGRRADARGLLLSRSPTGLNPTDAATERQRTKEGPAARFALEWRLRED